MSFPSFLTMTFYKRGFPCGSAGKEFACNAGNLGLSPGLGRSLFPGEGKGYPLQYSDLENSMNCMVHGVAKSRAQLSNFAFSFHFHALQKEVAAHSSVLAWRIPGMAEPGGLPSMGSHRVGHDWSDLAAAAASGICVESHTMLCTCVFTQKKSFVNQNSPWARIQFLKYCFVNSVSLRSEETYQTQ